MGIILGGVITVVATAPLSSMALTAMMGLTGVPMAIGALSVMGSSFMNGVFFHRMGFGDRKTYQMDPANGQEALREIGEDIEEGADLIIAKPALAYMDIMKEASMKYNIPIVAYNVSGEYAMVKAAAANGWIDEKKIVMENMVG